MQKIKNRNSLSSLNTKHQQNSSKKLEKSLKKGLKEQRSSTTHLNQYSKLLLLQKKQDQTSLALIKKYGANKSNFIQSVGHTRRQSEAKFQQFRKVDQFLQDFKKKKVQNIGFISNSNDLQVLQSTKIKRMIKTSQNGSQKSFHTKVGSMGKLCLGKNSMPQRIPTKEQRLNPFYEQPRIITENMITSKGVYNLINAGILPPEYDFLDILNNKYETIMQNTVDMIEKKPSAIMKIEEESQTFLTNPALMNQYEEHKKNSQAQLLKSDKTKNQNEDTSNKKQNKIRKTKLKKVKKVKNDPYDKLSEFLVFELPLLVISNGQVEKNDQYKLYLKQCLKQGIEQDFFQLIEKMQNLMSKYKIKKIRFKPNILYIKNLTQTYMLQLIQNHKILGMDKTIKRKQNILKSVIHRALDMHTMKKMKFYLKRIQNLKKYFRIRKLYHEYVDKRYNFYKYRLGSFAQEQRKFIEDFEQKKMLIGDFNPKIQIHILTKQTNQTEENTHYKLKQRLRAHMMRLFNSQPRDIIFLIDSVMMGDIKSEMQIFLKTVSKLMQKTAKVTNDRPNIHLLGTELTEQGISYTGRTYYGITSEIIKRIREICKDQRPVLIPYESCKLMPFICQTLNANLFGGTYTRESVEMIFDQDRKDDEQYAKSKNKENEHGFMKFKKLQAKHTFQTKISKLKTYVMANAVFQDKSNVYELFYKKLNKPMPFRIQAKGKNEIDFYEQMATKVISHRQSTKWVFKLGRSKFSRGIALFETNDLKIFQQNRKKTVLTSEDITQVAKLMSIILRDKINLCHTSLMQRRQFLTQFFVSQNSYVEEFIQNSQKICVFGKILPNGTFVLLGTYKKHYTNGIGFGASYPAQEVKDQMIEEFRQISAALFQQNVFGYVTFELLYQQRTKSFLYLDFTPNLEEYSSLYFLYNSLFKAENLYSDYFEFNTLPRSIFYCPFLDNNGNKFEDIDSFLDECRAKKIWYHSINQQGQRFMFYQNDPTVLGLIVFSNSEFQSIKMCIDAISFLVDVGGKFNQFDKNYIGSKDLKTDGLYMMDILWKLRQTRKKMENSIQQKSSNL